jgi:hypothetical protein
MDDVADGSKQGTWTYAGNLKAGLKVLLTTGLLTCVQSVQAIDTFANVYNFEVAETHNYYVGTEGVLVHNSCQVDALSKLYPNIAEAFWNDLKAAIAAISETEVPTALRVPFYTELARLDEATLKAFIQDFKAGSTDFKAGLLKDPSLIDVWKNIVSTRIPKNDVAFLTWAKNLKDRTIGQGKNLYEHIFVGKTGGTNGIQGVHHKNGLTSRTSGFASGDIRIRPGTTTNKADGFYEAEIEYFDGSNWIPKTENGIVIKNGFFPDSWNADRIMEEVAFARNKLVVSDWVAPILPKIKSNTFKSTLSNGQDVWFYIGQSTSSSPANIGTYMISIFPKF